jgi:hypothetical protein
MRRQAQVDAVVLDQVLGLFDPPIRCSASGGSPFLRSRAPNSFGPACFGDVGKTVRSRDGRRFMVRVFALCAARRFPRENEDFVPSPERDAELCLLSCPSPSASPIFGGPPT